jgi:anaerobic magnesium-protoporphyrin IX monomethyl ester cyclase
MNYLITIPRFSKKDEFYPFPFGLAYISSYLKSKGFKVFCLNLCRFEETESTMDILRNEIVKNNINAVLTGGMSGHWDLVDDVLNKTKRIDPRIVTIVGGPIVTSDPELAMENMPIDYGIVGEGEITSEELCHCLDTGQAPENVDGLMFKYDEKWLKTKDRSPILDLDSLPFPDYESFGYSEWLKLIQYSEASPILENFDDLIYAQIIGSRSCPYSCTFCYHPLGNRYRQRSIDNIFAEIDFLVEKYKVNFISFSDELFSANTTRLYEFADRLKKYGIKWDAQFRVNNITEEMLDRLKASNLVSIGFGVESLSDAILKSMKKMITKSEIETAFRLATESGIYCAGNIILGDPEETIETMNESIDWWKKHPQYLISLKFIKAIPDAEVYRHAVEKGIIKDKLKHVKENFPIVNMTKIPDEDFFRMKDEVFGYGDSLEYSLNGKIIKSEKMDEKYQNYNFYSLTLECENCGHVDKYKKFTRSLGTYTTVVCKKCHCSLKIEQKKAFFLEYHPIKNFLKKRLRRVYSKLLKKNVLDRHNRFVIRIKNLLKNI